MRRVLEQFRQRFTAIEAVDFFGSAGRDRVATLLTALESRLSQGTAAPGVRPGGDVDHQQYRNRLWVTRPRPGVDRMSSAWLIRRFIDPQARFGFVADREAAPRDALPFDMFGVAFSHQGDHCTFETLGAVFGIDDAAVSRLASIVHDLDFKDGRFGAPEAAAIAMVIDGLQIAYTDDTALLDQGIVLFDALYRAAGRATRPAGPRPMASRRRPAPRAARRRKPYNPDR